MCEAEFTFLRTWRKALHGLSGNRVGKKNKEEMIIKTNQNPFTLYLSSM